MCTPTVYSHMCLTNGPGRRARQRSSTAVERPSRRELDRSGAAAHTGPPSDILPLPLRCAPQGNCAPSYTRAGGSRSASAHYPAPALPRLRSFQRPAVVAPTDVTPLKAAPTQLLRVFAHELHASGPTPRITPCCSHPTAWAQKPRAALFAASNAFRFSSFAALAAAAASADASPKVY